MTLEFSEALQKLRELGERVDGIRQVVDLEAGVAQVTELEEKMGEPGFWDNNEKAQGTIAELKRLKGTVVPVQSLVDSVRDTLELAELTAEENDTDSLADIAKELERLETETDEVELATTLCEKHDGSNAWVNIHPGSGGTESCDWARILARMIERFCEKKGFKVHLVDRLEGEEAGIKSVTYNVKGENAYGYLRSEVGVHRLVRKSPFDARNRRHTSFAAVDVIPEADDLGDIEINESDLRIDTYRAGGAGGQHVNVTDSAVRITHLPTGVVVQCQNERSQHANKATAMKQLKARLIREQELEREKELQDMYGEKGANAFGSQIRNYVLEPYTLVKDRRTGQETGNVDAVLDGEILPFVEAYLRWKRRGGKPVEAGGDED